MSLNYIANVVEDQTLTKRSFVPSKKKSVISYGNASIQTTAENNTPAPIKVITNYM
ncbi:hypothetical protein MFLAVUS_008331 [Mucor flavus]|uniref:Uncharacterized protein n=1 Tax=Mucor flavus TaxID=439312 RepID=A0ABP9Z6R6_9FUNG